MPSPRPRPPLTPPSAPRRPIRRTTLLCLALAAALTTAIPLPATSYAAATPSLDFGPCPASVPAPAPPAHVECGSLAVPLDHDRPHGERIHLAVSRVRAAGTPSEHRGVLLVNPGGPGGSGLGYAVTKRAKLPEPVRRAYDIIGFDPRGTGRSAPANCGPMGGLFNTPGPDPVPRDSPAERAFLDGLRQLAADCAEGVGTALPHLSTVQTAHDMDTLRAALGEPTIGFLGVSYGSYLGAAYAAAHPHRVGKMVLDSVVGPWDWHDFDVRQARALLRQRDDLFRWLARDPARYGLGATPQAVRASYTRVRNGLAAHPAGRTPTRTDSDGGFGPAEFDRAVYRALGRTERWAGLGDGLRRYLRDGSADGLRPDEDFAGPASRTYEAANRTVKCADGPGPRPARVLTDIRALRRLDPLPVLTGLEADACAYWKRQPEQRTPLGSPQAPPVLLVASDHDPITPIEGAHALRRTLPGSRLITLHNDYSHGVFASRGNACVDDTVAKYLLDGVVPTGDVGCAGAGVP
ncbi:alpha/beta hydrolase [Streptomyces halobius]|uniref:Alpha/beta hydrolase n=1 Tax=Streptomyces halobius TaxID=2879846 RepID=A0ABY4MB23_9ACTN|nr:alpha/beta hydrolase [Streptomyces halobius]UQA94883.1 alpha/beta hydrolase [Streptomyces halobius]